MTQILVTKLRQARMSRCISASLLAKILNVSSGGYSLLENKRGVRTWRLAKKIGKILDLPPEDIIEDFKLEYYKKKKAEQRKQKLLKKKMREEERLRKKQMQMEQKEKEQIENTENKQEQIQE
jgi:DNA-binding XRE family transcriptional regulator